MRMFTGTWLGKHLKSALLESYAPEVFSLDLPAIAGFAGLSEIQESASSRQENMIGPDLQISQIRKAYGDVVAVDELSLSVRGGTFVTLLGPSGCGKTTLLRMIAGLEVQSSGSISIDGRALDNVPAHKRSVNTVFQNYALFPHLTVFENVAFGLNLQKLPRKEVIARASNMLSRVQLEKLAHRRPHELSGGQQQRVALARALVNGPKVLLLDEPLGALDLKLRREMQLELKRLQRSFGISFIYVTHDQEEALTLSDVIVVMWQGRIEQIGSPEDIYREPKTRFVADFLGVNNLLDGTIKSVHGKFCEVTIPQIGVLRCPAPPGCSPGKPCSLALRPEEILLNSSTDEANQIVGLIDDVIFLGTKYQILVRLQNNQLIECVVPALSGESTKYVRQEPLRLSWSNSVGRLLTAST